MNFSALWTPLLAVLLLTGVAGQAWAQPASAPAGAQSAAPGVPWGSLNTVQKQALAPLANAWTSLSEGQRRKWIAIAQNYPNLPPADQEKLHSRMVDWAALTPVEREQARLNFAKTKSVAKPERAANWEAYQALSPQEKQKLATGAATLPPGAAVAPKPVSPEKLAPVPVTRHTPESQKAAAGASAKLDRNTLLPQKTASSTDNSGTAPAAKP